MSGLKVTEIPTFRYEFMGIARGPNHVRATVQGAKFRQLLVRYLAIEKQYQKASALRFSLSPSGPYGQGPSYSDIEKTEDSLRRAMGSLITEMKNHRGFMQQPNISLRREILPNGFYIRVAEGRNSHSREENKLFRGNGLLNFYPEDLGGGAYRLVAVAEGKV